MGVSFKVSKVGKRYKPNELLQTEDKEAGNDSQERIDEGKLEEDGISSYSNELAATTLQQLPEDLEVSFSLNLFLNGYCVGKPKEFFNAVPTQLLPYNRASEPLFTAIEYGWLPGDIFSQIPCKYANGAVLCEILDYRNCLYRREGMASAATSPTIHKVLLQMCMENVVKDISSTSNNCWTYEVLLEVESRILTALQPHLQLSPELLLNKCYGELPCKKINLRINWDRKKRKLNDASLCNPQHLICMQSLGGAQNSKSQSGLAYHGRDVQVSQNDLSRAVPSFQVDRAGLEQIQPNPVTLKPNYHLSYGCQTSAIADFSSSPTNSSKRVREPILLVPSETSGFETQTIEGLALKKPKREPEEFSLQQLPGDGGKVVAPDLSSKKITLYQHVEAGKVMHKNFSDQRGLCSFTSKGEQEIPQRNPKLHHKMSFSTVKQEPAETTKLSDSKMKDKSSTINMSSPPNVQKKRSQKSSSSSKANCHPANTVEKILRNNKSTQKSKDLPNPQVIVGVKNALSRSCNGNSLLREASLQARQQNNIPRVLRANMTGSLVSASNELTADVRYTLGNPHPRWVSNVEGNFYLQKRFMKLGWVTKRYKLNDRKQKSDPPLQRKPFLWTPLVSHHLANFENNVITGRSTSMSECSVSQEQNISKTRTLTFSHQSYVRQGSANSQSDGGNQIKLVISEMVNEGKVEATIIYGVEETAYTSLTFPSISFADLFVAQFQSLVVNEGYCTAVSSFGNQLSTPCQTSDESTSISPAMTDRTSNTRQLSFGNHLVPYVNSQSPLQILPSNLSEFQLDIAAQGARTHMQQSDILAKRAYLEFQMMQRQRMQDQLVQKMKLDGQGATDGRGSGSFRTVKARSVGALQIGNLVDMLNRGSSRIGNIGQLINPSSFIYNWNPQSQQSGINFDQPTGFPARVGVPAGRGEVLMNGISTQNRRPTLADMGYQMNNQELSQAEMYWQLQMPYSRRQQQQEMVTLLQSAEAALSIEHVHLPLSQVYSQQFEQLS